MITLNGTELESELVEVVCLKQLNPLAYGEYKLPTSWYIEFENGKRMFVDNISVERDMYYLALCEGPIMKIPNDMWKELVNIRYDTF